MTAHTHTTIPASGQVASAVVTLPLSIHTTSRQRVMDADGYEFATCRSAEAAAWLVSAANRMPAEYLDNA